MWTNLKHHSILWKSVQPAEQQGQFMKKYYAPLLFGFILSGCTITTMEAKIDPQPQVQASTIGNGKKVGVIVVDERPSKNLGKRSSIGGTIEMNEDLAVVYQTAIMKGLSAKGFSPVGGVSPDGSNLKVELRGLNQVSTTGFWTMGADIDAAMKVVVTGGSAPYEQMYRAASSNRTIVVSGAKALNKKMNAVVNDQIEAMFNDQALLTALAAK
ncbi:YajG family lipoprotein [Sphingobium sp. CR2-8]|uniref:YajG family lipoprotein n=1 Tax=Sphingobium sp. CR2-8 TaxID=1306534 RepID=UPI002DBF4DA6|nr:YajG family lipoprotein [Sphingobium sp. CR2-8]MEC3912193.1 YajG family lipoprotein [Sphingobium sp. CR2-8]